MGGFVGLIWNFCAAVSPPWDGPATVRLGYQSQGECIVRIIVGDSHGETVTINDHTISIEIIEGGAQINIDNQGFTLINTNGA